MAQTFKPLNDRVLVKRINAEDKTAGGILIPDNAKEKPSEGRVVAVGSGKVVEGGKRKAPEIKEGDRVLFGKWSGSEVKFNGEDCIILKEEEVMAVLE
jgi:chaperonin GroES